MVSKHPSREQNRVKPLGSPGTWVFEGGFREQAIRALALSEQASIRLKHEWEDIRRQHGEEAADRAISHEKFVDVDLLTNTTVVLSAMAIESFLNYYGVVRMGEEFYSRHYERLGLVKKLSVVVATCCGVLLDKKSEIVSVTRRLSERRNKLAHPKTRELKPGPFLIPTEGALAVAKDSATDMNRFLDLFIELDPDALSAVSTA